MLNDGRMLIDNGVVAETYTDGFCLDNFVYDSHTQPVVSAFVCNNVLHSLRLQPQLNQHEHNDGVCSSATELKKFRFYYHHFLRFELKIWIPRGIRSTFFQFPKKATHFDVVVYNLSW